MRITSRIVLLFVLLGAALAATIGVLSYRSGSESDGPGRGATFTLKLTLDRKESIL